ncbi:MULTISPECIES: gephyrin-like molybdotransferase receptor GlpR [unclassified Mycobacterium]|uniref:divisome protein SepX/GlpR n=1 Tax=unclassified Mycobacterium TaxID=2642494 RepID=UPI0029C77E6A|nr:MULTISPECIES: gephyrin-like molybdotransferase receptor GlpR [unclassified Mycobacterium]
MPSIPQSLLWISLVVLWLFVLVPMLISKRDTVRRTSDVALAARVVNTGRGARLLRRRRPAAGHVSDPHWAPTEDDHDLDFEGDDAMTAPRKTIVVAASNTVTESLYLDVDVVELDSGALPVGATAGAAEQAELPLDLGLDGPQAGFEEEFEEALEDFERESEQKPASVSEVPDDSTQAIRTVTEADFEVEPEELDDLDDAEDEYDDAESDGTEHDYEYVDDTSGLEAPSEAEGEAPESMSHARRRSYETATAAAVSARKFKFRKRVLLAMGVALLASAIVAYVVTPTMWWVCGTVGAVTLLYLGYLRRQTRIEEQVRRRRAQRMARSRLGVENTNDGEFDVVPSRLRRPGSVVLEIDDEDPIFEHLDHPAYEEYHLARASGE